MKTPGCLACRLPQLARLLPVAPTQAGTLYPPHSDSAPREAAALPPERHPALHPRGAARLFTSATAASSDSTPMADATPCARQPPSWAEIPQDLAGKVLSLLPTHADRVRFAAVCPQWRAAARQLRVPRPLPVLALPDGAVYSLPDGKPLHFPGLDLAGFKTACGSWLVFRRDDGCFLVDPFTGTKVTLPALSCVRLIPPDAVARYIRLGIISMFHPYATWMHIIEPNKTPAINKLIMCSPNLFAALIGSTMANAAQNSQILVCRPGSSLWSVQANDRCLVFDDMALYQGKLYAIARDENLLIVNISEDPSSGDPQVSQIQQVIKGDPFDAGLNSVVKKKIYLVESCGTLLMVRRKVFCREEDVGLVAGQSEFEVFKADLEQSEWAKSDNPRR
ncbi:hypothetical protein EJB05_12641 [Eragrostis curvula]|uniref:F-box domain-containing protein n=1 Tax=Eragrostis curvula TaxID=38414 RepID=A0A5J9VS53_9POAL|nr:hypothetical protein EJB05_12641 [Eragrostis curvula]